ncbi:MAG: hypothetical protein ACYC0X_11340 [Pirellulaceae bacterium]
MAMCNARRGSVSGIRLYRSIADWHGAYKRAPRGGEFAVPTTKGMTDAKAGAFRAVLLSEQSRMSREDVFDAMVHWKQLRDAGVKIVTFQRGEAVICHSADRQADHIATGAAS